MLTKARGRGLNKSMYDETFLSLKEQYSYSHHITINVRIVGMVTYMPVIANIPQPLLGLSILNSI